MQGGWLPRLGRIFLGWGFLLVVMGGGSAWGDDSGLLGRIFRFGGGPGASGAAPRAGGQPAPLPYSRDPGAQAGLFTGGHGHGLDAVTRGVAYAQVAAAALGLRHRSRRRRWIGHRCAARRARPSIPAAERRRSAARIRGQLEQTSRA